MAFRRRLPRAGVAALVAAALVVLGALPLAAGPAGASGDDPVPVPVVSDRPGVTVTPTGPYRNVVVVLVDDLSTTLLDSHPRLTAMAAGGVRFTDYVVTDSLCCTSRTSFLTGRYVHNHGVLSNMPRRNGGWPEYARIGWDDDNLGLWLQRGGIRTGYVGKYLNAYPSAAEPARIPKGWDDWFLPDARSYLQYGYSANDAGVVRQYGSAPEDYNTDVLAAQASEFIATSGDEPFFLTVAPFSPHLPATPPSDTRGCSRRRPTRSSRRATCSIPGSPGGCGGCRCAASSSGRSTSACGATSCARRSRSRTSSTGSRAPST